MPVELQAARSATSSAWRRPATYAASSYPETRRVSLLHTSNRAVSSIRLNITLPTPPAVICHEEGRVTRFIPYRCYCCRYLCYLLGGCRLIATSPCVIDAGRWSRGGLVVELGHASEYVKRGEVRLSRSKCHHSSASMEDSLKVRIPNTFEHGTTAQTHHSLVGTRLNIWCNAYP